MRRGNQSVHRTYIAIRDTQRFGFRTLAAHSEPHLEHSRHARIAPRKEADYFYLRALLARARSLRTDALAHLRGARDSILTDARDSKAATAISGATPFVHTVNGSARFRRIGTVGDEGATTGRMPIFGSTVKPLGHAIGLPWLQNETVDL
jgi:hypothetical protein